METKRSLYPQHSVEDPVDPYNLLLRIAATVSGSVLADFNSALLGIDPQTLRSRGALLALARAAGYKLARAVPASGLVIAQLKDAPAGATLFADGARFVSEAKVHYSVDSAVSEPASASLDFGVLSTTGDFSASSGVVDLAAGERFIVRSPDNAAFDKLKLTLSAQASGSTFAVEASNSAWGTPTEVSVLSPSVVKVYLDEYVNVASAGATVAGAQCLVRLRSTGVGELSTVEYSGGRGFVVVSSLGQSDPASSTYDYEVFMSWIPLSSASLSTASVETSIAMAGVFSTAKAHWDSSEYGRALAYRLVSGPGAFTVSAAEVTGNWYVVFPVRQGWRRTELLGAGTGEPYQRLSLRDTPVVDVSAPRGDYRLTIAGTRWEIVDDFGNSTATSTHATVLEDSSGWYVQFGSGVVGAMPQESQSIYLEYRALEASASELNAWAPLKPTISSPKVDAVYAPFGINGYVAREADSANDVLEVRGKTFRRAAVRQDSVVTVNDIELAVTGASTDRAMFTTADGRTPFSRCAVDRSGATKFKTYKVVVVGPLDSPNGRVQSDDVDELAVWLNGRVVGVERQGGRGPVNSTAVCVGFTPVPLTPSVTVTSRFPSQAVQAAVFAVLKSLLRPHARDARGEWLWPWNGGTNVAQLYYSLLVGLGGMVDTSSRVPLALSFTDGTTTWGAGDVIPTSDGRLPVLSPAFAASAVVVQR